jgi:predicted NBD/HSP70 family sugar kinase
MTSRRSQTPAVPSLLRRLNARLVLETMHAVGPCTRADLVRHTGISPPTMSKLIEGLFEAGLVEEDPDRVLTNGRPGVRFRLAARNVQVLGAVVDVHSCTVLSCGLDGRIEPALTRTLDTPADYPALLRALTAALKDVRKQRGVRCLGLGVTVPGLLNRDTRCVVFSPNMHFLDGHDLARDLAQKLDVEALTLQEDYALCIAERMFGGARLLHDFAVVEMHAGFGAGMFSNGQFISGTDGYGGELGHITVNPDGPQCGCGNHGCLELYATDAAFARAVAARRGRPAPMADLVAQARAGTFDPAPFLGPVLDYLAIGVAGLLNIFNPSAVFIYGDLFELGADVLPQLRTRVEQRALRPSFKTCRIERSQVNKQLAAVSGIIQHLHNQLGPRLGRA